MPRTARASVGGEWYHVFNRGNRGEDVFHQPADYDAFAGSMIDASARLPLDLLGYCLMPNHLHLVIRPWADGDLGRWVQWVLTAHSRRYHREYHTSGHVWQGRFKAFPIQEGAALRTVAHYMESNALRAKLVARAEDWKWSSLPGRLTRDPSLWRAKSGIRASSWLARVNQPLSDDELHRLRLSVQRGRPFGDDAWTRETVRRLGLESTIRPRGRPPKHAE